MISKQDVIESFSEEGLSITAEQAEGVLEFLQGLAKVVLNDYFKESSCNVSGNTVFNNT
jgi:hypothetical protein